MKAWIASDKNCDCGSEIIFADTRGKAISKALGRDIFAYLEFTDIRIHRLKELDGMEDREPTDNPWLNDEIRLILVKEYDWACMEPEYSDCDSCVAKQYCHYFD